MCPEASHERIFTKFCITVEVVDVITSAKFFSDQLRDVNSVGVENEGFPLTKSMAVNTGLAQLCHLRFLERLQAKFLVNRFRVLKVLTPSRNFANSTGSAVLHCGVAPVTPV